MENKKKNILLISFVFSPNIGGVESHLDELCSFLVNKGHAITVVTYKPIITNEKAPFKEKKKGITIYRIPWLRMNLFNRLEKIPVLEFLYIVPGILFFSFFYILINTRKIDVLQVHGFNMAFVGAVLHMLFRKKLVINTHVSFYFPKKSLYSQILSRVLNFADSILVLTKRAKKELIKIGISPKKIIVYHQWINEALFNSKNQIQSREKFNLPKNSFIVSFTGRFVPAKGVNLLLQAAKKVQADVVFTFVGSGPLLSVIKEESTYNKRIKYIGKISQKDLPYYYCAADVCIIPSFQATSTYAEGIPRVFIESLQCGTPVVVTQTGGVEELINKNIGYTIQPSVTSISQTIEGLYKKKKFLTKMKLACKEFAQKEFGFTSNAKIIEKSLL